MSTKPEYERGYGDGYRWTIYWLHERAKAMNDPHARAILNGAAFNLGVEGKERMYNRFGSRKDDLPTPGPLPEDIDHDE